MVSVNPNPAQGFSFFDPMNMEIHARQGQPAGDVAGTAGMMSLADDSTKKVRKPYTITKSRESWTEQEHDKFLEALQLFDRDWKKIEAFVGSKTVIQIRSHAQKYFLKVQKSGTSEHVPPPRPKRKAAHPYPQKAPKNVAVSQVASPLQPLSVLSEAGYIYRQDKLSSGHGNPVSGPLVQPWNYDLMQPVSMSRVTKDETRPVLHGAANNNCYSSSNESMLQAWNMSETTDPENYGEPARGCLLVEETVRPDFAQVYHFIGSVFDPSSTDHLQRLRQMDPINMETVLILMRNLFVNLTSPELEDHKRLLASYSNDNGTDKRDSGCADLRAIKSETLC